MASSKPPARTLSEFEQTIAENFRRMSEDEGYKGFDAEIHRSHARFESASRGPPAQVTYLLTATPELCNKLGSLHGGCAATIIDNLSTTILVGVSKPGLFSYGGVSRGLRVTYLRPVPEGTEVRVVCEVIHVGKRMALLRGEIRRADNDNICVVAEHDKANTDPDSMKI